MIQEKTPNNDTRKVGEFLVLASSITVLVIVWLAFRDVNTLWGAVPVAIIVFSMSQHSKRALYQGIASVFCNAIVFEIVFTQRNPMYVLLLLIPAVVMATITILKG